MKRGKYVVAITITVAAVFLLVGFDTALDLRSKALGNETAYIPAQCYTMTISDSGRVLNSCYPCHTTPLKPNRTFDEGLQEEYAFPGPALANPWTNLFTDRTRAAAAITDAQILEYVRTPNYSDAAGRLLLADRLTQLPREWDADGDGRWSGYVPDCGFRLDDQGFDHDACGAYTGWRAYGYYPFPSTHWPTNGSLADVLIRLPEPFRQDTAGRFDKDVYTLNLAILESLIKEADIAIEPTDEGRAGVDLNRNGAVDTATRIAFRWAPLDNEHMRFAVRAGELQRRGEVQAAAGLFPVGTELLQTLRYFDVAGGDLRMAPRFKEVRYARKARWYTYAELETIGMNELKERSDFPDRTRLPVGRLEHGVANGRG
jgi:hypothetical protein